MSKEKPIRSWAFAEWDGEFLYLYASRKFINSIIWTKIRRPVDQDGFYGEIPVMGFVSSLRWKRVDLEKIEKRYQEEKDKNIKGQEDAE